MRRRLACLLSLLLLAGVQAHAGELLIESALADDGALLLSYTPPVGVTELKRWNRSEAARDFWREQIKPLDDCSSFDEDMIRLRPDVACKTVRLRIEPKLLSRVASYEAAQPISGTGLIAYSGFYAAALPGQALRWRWLAPQDGYVLQAGQVERRGAELLVDAATVDRALALGVDEVEAWSLLGARQYAYLGRAPLLGFKGGSLVRDPTLDDARVGLIRGTLERTMQDLTLAYGAIPPGPVGVVASSSDLSGFQGDVSDGRMMRLRLDRTPLEAEGADAVQQFVTHEAVHWWNMGLRHSDPTRPWLHEGHADWATLLMLRQHGVWDEATATTMSEQVLNHCLLARGNHPAASLPPGYSKQDDAYACGFALMMLAQAQRHNDQSERSPLALLATLHPRNAVLDTPRFATWADGAASGPMHALLFDEKLPFASAYLARLQALGLADTQPLADTSTGIRAQVAGRLLIALMVADCGSFGFSANYGGDFGFFKLDSRPRSCRSLRRGGEVMAVDGKLLIADPLAAWDAASAACAEGQPLQIGYRQGPPSQMACPIELPAPPVRELLRLKPDALQRIGVTSDSRK